jgi:hypothetical protein
MDVALIEEYSIKFCTKLIVVITQLITTVSFITLLVNWYDNGLLPHPAIFPYSKWN